jgi:hypothetical protein
MLKKFNKVEVLASSIYQYINIYKVSKKEAIWARDLPQLICFLIVELLEMKYKILVLY